MGEIYKQMFDENVRIQECWPFPVSPAPARLIELFEDVKQLPEELLHLMSSWSDEDRKAFADGGWQAQDAFSELCAAAFRKGVFGWIGVLAVPVFTPTKSGGALFSWSHYHTKVAFADTADNLMKGAVAWGRETYEKETAQ